MSSEDIKSGTSLPFQVPIFITTLNTSILRWSLLFSIMNPISSTEYDDHKQNYFPDDAPPPAYEYGFLFNISHMNELIAGKSPYCYLDSCEKVYNLTNTAKRHRSKLLLLPSTREAIKNAFSTHQQLRVVGLMSLPAAFVHDLLSPPYHLTQMAMAVSRSKYERKKAENKISDEIMESLLLSLETVVKVITGLGLETHEAVKQQICNGGAYVHLTLARLLEAYGSRFAPSGTVYLGSQKRLAKEHCSGIARLHFEQIHNLKESLMFVDLFPAHNFSDASAVLECWFRRVLPALKGSFMERDEDYHLSHVLQRLRNIQDELQGLVLLVPEK